LTLKSKELLFANNQINYIYFKARVVEQVDTKDLKSFGASSRCAGSIPAPGITLPEPIDLKTDNQAI
jgi:hypothetical protein